MLRTLVIHKCMDLPKVELKLRSKKNSTKRILFIVFTVTTKCIRVISAGERGHRNATSYQALLFQRDLTDSCTTEVEATVNDQKSVINLYKAASITLTQDNIQIDEANR